MRDQTLPLEHFEQLYARSSDPWNFAGSAYESAKYAATLAALPRARYSRALEVGCSIGIFTAVLAERCDSLLALEPVATALSEARARNAARPWVRFAPAFIPRDWPNERFELVVVSEVLDYIGAADLARTAECLQASLEPGGDLVMVHWVGKKHCETAKPDEASEILITALGDAFKPVQQRRNSDYRLDVLRRES